MNPFAGIQLRQVHMNLFALERQLHTSGLSQIILHVSARQSTAVHRNIHEYDIKVGKGKWDRKHQPLVTNLMGDYLQWYPQKTNSGYDSELLTN